MELCIIARFVLIFSVIGIILEMYIMSGTTIVIFILNVITTVIAVSVANWACFKEGYNWIAWIVVIISIFSLAFLIHLAKNKNSLMTKDYINSASLLFPKSTAAP